MRRPRALPPPPVGAAPRTTEREKRRGGAPSRVGLAHVLLPRMGAAPLPLREGERGGRQRERGRERWASEGGRVRERGIRCVVGGTEREELRGEIGE